MPKQRVWSKESLYNFLDKKLAGENIAALAREINLSPCRLHEIINKAARIRAREKLTGIKHVMVYDKYPSNYNVIRIEE